MRGHAHRTGAGAGASAGANIMACAVISHFSRTKCSYTSWPRDEALYEKRASPSLPCDHLRYSMRYTLRLRVSYAAQAKGLAGIHGAGMAWVAMLDFPSSKALSTAASIAPSRRCFLLEIFPSKMNESRTTSKRDYWMWSAVAGCTLSRLVQPDAPECAGPHHSFRYCGNVTVSVGQVVSRLEELTRTYLL